MNELHDSSEMSAMHGIIRILEGEGVRHIFGIPGGPLTPLYEALLDSRIRKVLTRHEQGASYMATTYARVSRGLGVCCATSGPGACNALTGIASAYTDSIPVLILTGQVSTRAFGKGAIQESTVHGIDTVDLFKPVTKLSTMLPTGEGAAALVRLALRTALSGRPGPVHISIPADVAKRPVHYRHVPPSHYRAQSTGVDREGALRAARLLVEAERPVIIAGHGVALAGAWEELLMLSELLGLPVATTPKGKGVFPENHRLSLGVFGFGGHDRADEYILSGAPDVVMVVGSALGEFATNAWVNELQPTRALVQIDIDPTEIGKNYPADVGIVGDARVALTEIYDQIHRLSSGFSAAEDPLAALRDRVPKHLNAEASDSDRIPLKPQRLMRELRALLPDDGMLFVDNGNSIIWGTHYFEARQPETYFIDLGLASMGSAVAGVVGGKLAAPSRAAVALVGDAAFAMNGNEVHTAADLGIPVIWIVLNNGGHGMVAQGERLLRGSHLESSLFNVPLDACAWGNALGATGYKVRTPDEFRRAFATALEAPGPSVIDAVIDPDEVAPTLIRRAQTLAKFFRQGQRAFRAEP